MGNHITLFVIRFKVVPFTNHVKKRSTVYTLFKKLTLGKVDKWDLTAACKDIEAHPFNPIIIHVHNSEETKEIKKLVKLVNELDDKGVIVMEECDFDNV